MFYFLLAPTITYNIILIIAAVIPAVFLMIKVYRSDRLGKESPGLLFSLVRGGVLAALAAMLAERLFSWLLDLFLDEYSVAYNVLLYFGVVAVSEELAKYLFMRRYSWRSREFTSAYDGVVYAVFTSLGFALWENISYVLHFGFRTALVRAVTAIPGHACFGIFMGVFYGLARKYEYAGKHTLSTACSVVGLICAVLLHGTYDYIASMESTGSGWIFAGFVAVLFAISYITVSRASKNDEYIDVVVR
ncbi:MAG: PrsW family intramembrane metalloprotease [Clostridia bacterium]|nr:PrsW family intramembrane metalloprotease [Clostridia bacterium]